MNIAVTQTSLDGVLEIVPLVFEDFRGYYIETYNKASYHAAGINQEFIQDDISVSDKHVLRGIHGDAETWKLISCLYGKFYLAVVDCRKDALTFGKWQTFTLTAANRKQVLVPPGFGNGHLVLSEKTIFHYKQTSYYAPETQFTYRYDHHEFDIYWPVTAPILSKRDRDCSW